MPNTYLVTGASSGLGLEIVTELVARGDKVFVTCRKKSSSVTGIDRISKVVGDVTIIEGIDVALNDCKAALLSALGGVVEEIDVVVHNAGGANGTRELQGMAVMGDQSFDSISTEYMMDIMQVNTFGPIRVQQVLQAKMKAPGGKIVT